MKTFFYLMDLAIVNSWIIDKRLKGTEIEKMTIWLFRANLARSLYADGTKKQRKKLVIRCNNKKQISTDLEQSSKFINSKTDCSVADH